MVQKTSKKSTKKPVKKAKASTPKKPPLLEAAFFISPN